MVKTFLDTAYAVDPADGARGLYEAWADSYDAEIAANGYATPRRCAEALARHAPELTAPVLDFGCGTGLAGLALRAAGFSVVDGVDIAPAMLAQARVKGCYRRLATIAAERPDISSATYAAIVAVGVIGPGHAPPETLDLLLSQVLPGGLVVVSLNDETLRDAAFSARIPRLTLDGKALLLQKEHGPHLPGRDLGATVFVLRAP
jgi:predicted TPR repeat methyltransferase